MPRWRPRSQHLCPRLRKGVHDMCVHSSGCADRRSRFHGYIYNLYRVNFISIFSSRIIIYFWVVWVYSMHMIMNMTCTFG